MGVTVAVLIPTFNRRRLFREALASVVNARPDEIHVVDDGTDLYDVAAMVEGDFIAPSEAQGYRIRWGVVSAPPMTVDERMQTPRQGSLLNKALEAVTSDVACYLCDDDLMAPDWCDAIRAHWSAYPGRELARGTWLQFEDGATPSESDPPCPMDMVRGMTAGNFAHHASLTRDRGVRWSTDRLNCLDDAFLHAMQSAKVDTFRVPVIGFAGWARRHAHQNGNYSDGQRHVRTFRAVLEQGYLEAQR